MATGAVSRIFPSEGLPDKIIHVFMASPPTESLYLQLASQTSNQFFAEQSAAKRTTSEYKKLTQLVVFDVGTNKMEPAVLEKGAVIEFFPNGRFNESPNRRSQIKEVISSLNSNTSFTDKIQGDELLFWNGTHLLIQKGGILSLYNLSSSHNQVTPVIEAPYNQLFVDDQNKEIQAVDLIQVATKRGDRNHEKP